MNSYKNKVKSLFGNDIDAALLFNGSTESSNFLYMTGFNSGVFEDTPLLLLRDRMVLFSSILEYSTAIEQASMHKDIEVEKIANKSETISKIQRFTRGKRLGFDGDYLPFGDYMRLKALAKPKTATNISDRFSSLERSRMSVRFYT